MLGKLFHRERKVAPALDPWSLDTPILRWSADDAWTIGDAVQGCLTVGATGSGKSSGSGAAIARAFLAHGFGGLVLTAKPDDVTAWKRYCAEAKRGHDLLIFSPEGDLRFDFLSYELQRPGRGGGLTENVVQLLATVLEVAERGTSGSGGRDDESYWKRALRQLMRNVVDLLALSTGKVTVPDLYRLVISAPTSREQARSEEWRRSSFCMWCLTEADKRERSPRQQRDFELVADYWLVEYPALSDKTRSVILSTFTSMVDVLNRGLLGELFCTTTNVTPDLVENGKIIVVDLPVKEFAEVGQFAQVLWKTAFQRAIERRDVTKSPRPVFLFADEAQYIITSNDMSFQTTCRSARVATCYLTQNISNVYAALGGSDKGKIEAASLFGNLNTKVLHANGDPVTNEWASGLVGRTKQFFANGSTSHGPDDVVESALSLAGMGQRTHSSAGFNESYEYELQPSVFTQLRTGGARHAQLVDAVVFQNGRVFRSSGRTWTRATFRQEGRGS